MNTFNTFIDISWPITPDMTAYKDKKTVHFAHAKTFEQDSARESVITLGSHTGTHIDAPAHFLMNGQAIDALHLQNVVGPCRVLDLTNVTQKITHTDLAEKNISAGEILLFKTKNSALSATAPFDPNFVYVDATVAHFLAEKKVKTVGIDYLGIERQQPDHATHATLMEHGVTIIEGLRLAHVDAGNYFLICLPLNVVGLEAAPARAILCTSKLV